MPRIMAPHRAPPKASSEAIMKSIAVEKVIVDENRMAVPVRAPAPKSPAPPAAKTIAKVETNAKTEAEGGVVERRIISVQRRSPDVEWIISWDVNDLRIGRLDYNDLPPILILSLDCLLGCR